MCYCDDWDFTINRADEFMVSKKSDGRWFSISPEDIWNMIQKMLASGELNIVWKSEDEAGKYYQVEGLQNPIE